MRYRAAAAPLLMAASGASALAYETVWLRQLSRAFGVTVYAVASLVALYMAGLALGAALASRRMKAGDWLRRYGALELAAGACALAATWWLARLPVVVAAWSPEAPLGLAPRLLLAAPALLPPTILLGATLPVLARDGGDPALLYGANTLGALAGLWAASFLTIGAWGEAATIGLAAAVNAVAGAAALALSGRARRKSPASAAGRAGPAAAVPFFLVAGFCALGCEVLWARQLIPLLGNSTYAFALILGAYLAGVGLGSALPVDAGEKWSALASLLAALGASIALSAAASRFIGLRLDSPEFLYSPLRAFADFPLVAFQAAVLVFPASFVLGLLFRAQLALAGGDEGAVGRLYAWGTLGGIAGSLWCGFAGIARLGAHGCELLLAALACAAAVAAAARAGRGPARAACAALSALALAAAAYAPRDPSPEIVRNRLLAAGETAPRLLFCDESPAATIMGFDRGPNRSLFINGVAAAGRGLSGALMAIVPDLIVARPRRVLIICLGPGNAFRAASRLGASVDAVELIADVARRVTVFQDDGAADLSKPGNRVLVEDGRGFLLRSRERYDVIVVDATPPLYSAGAVNLYTREFMDLARERLTEEGVLALWLPTGGFESDYWRILRSLGDAFPHAATWESPYVPGFLALGSREALGRTRAELERRFRARVAAAFPDPRLSAAKIAGGFRVPETALRARTSSYEPLTDDRPGVEFPLARFWRREPLIGDTAFLGE